MPAPAPGSLSPGASGRGLGALRAIATLMAVAAFLAFKVLGLYVFARHSSTSTATGANNGWSPIAVDGRSDLPGGRASVSYTALPGEREWVRQRSIDAPNDGSIWWLRRDSDGAPEAMILGYYVFRPPFDSPSRLHDFRVQNDAENSAKARRAIHGSVERVAGRDAYVYRFSTPNGQRIVQAWLIGPINSYVFECRINRSDHAMWRQCTATLRTLTADR